MYMEVEGARPKGRPRKTWLEVAKNSTKGLDLASADALVHHAWRNQKTEHMLT